MIGPGGFMNGPKAKRMRYMRAPFRDKRIRRGDHFAGDAWLDLETGEVRYVAVGQDPNIEHKEK